MGPPAYHVGLSRLEIQAVEPACSTLSVVTHLNFLHNLGDVPDREIVGRPGSFQGFTGCIGCIHLCDRPFTPVSRFAGAPTQHMLTEGLASCEGQAGTSAFTDYIQLSRVPGTEPHTIIIGF